MITHSTLNVYAVVLNYNGASCNERCLRSLLQQDYPNLTVLFVDNGSTDGSLKACQAKFADQIEFIENGVNYYFAKGNNLGIAHALKEGADYVFIVNNDTELAPSCVSELVTFMGATPEAGGCQPLLMKMYDGDESSYNSDWGGEIASAGIKVSLGGRCWDLSMGRRVDDIGFSPFVVPGITGGAMFLPADILRKTKGFDESFVMYFEDVDLSFRIQKLGRPLYTIPRARMGHFVAKTTSTHAPILRIQRCEANSYRLIAKHFPRQIAVKAILISTIFSICTACYSLFCFDFAKTLAICKGATEGLGVCVQSWKKIASKTRNQSMLSAIETLVWYPPSFKTDNRCE